MDAVFAYRPAVTYTYPAIPYGFQPQFFFYSTNRFMAKPFGNTLSVGLWCDTATEMNKALNWTGGSTPPVEPPVEPPVVSGKIVTLDQAILAIEGLLTWQEKIRGA
jgi:hypothetical protein